MIVVHGLVLPDGTLACWAESPDAALHPSGHSATAAHGPAEERATAVHPFAVLPPLPGTVDTADLLLPSTPHRPVPSPELTAHLPAGHRRPAARRHTRWTVPIVVLPPATDPELLLSTAPDTTPGSSIGALADLVTFATDLVDRGRFLPALTTESPGPHPGPDRGSDPSPDIGSDPSPDIGSDPSPDIGSDPSPDTGADSGSGNSSEAGADTGSETGRQPEPGHRVERFETGRGPAARWRPALWGADATTADALCRAMPGVAASATDPSLRRLRLPADRPAWSPADATRTALDTTVDHLVRARLAGEPLLGDGQVRNDTAVRAWLAALTTPDARLRTAAPAHTPAAPGGATAARARAQARAIAEAAARREPVPAGKTAADDTVARREPVAPPRIAAPAPTTETEPRSAARPEPIPPRSATKPAPTNESAVSREPVPPPTAEAGSGRALARAIAEAAARREPAPAAEPATSDAAARPEPAANETMARLDSRPRTGEPARATTQPRREPVTEADPSEERPARTTVTRRGPVPSLSPAEQAPAGQTATTEAAQAEEGEASEPDRAADADADAVVRAAPAMDDGPEVARLREVLERWADSGRPAPVRTCFRLSYVEAADEDDDLAPDPAGDRRKTPGPGRADPDGGSWLVEFLLQPAAEPGLLVPAQDVWHDGASPLFKWVDYPQDVLLADLGRAGRLWPDLDEALWVPRPVSLRLDTPGAYRFLTCATLLHDAGFGVLLPAQWQRRQDLGLTLTVRTRQPAAPVLRDTTTNRAAIVAYRWGLAIGDEFLSEADLAELARAKVPLVRLRGRWVHLDRERLRAGLAFLRRGGRGEMTAGEAMRLTRLVPDGDLPLPVTGVDGEGWLADLLTGRAAERLELLDPPPGLTAQLRPYQRRGLSWLAFLDAVGVGALLADDMGLGKTVQVLALEAHLRARGPRPPTLVVCPLSVLGNWRREIERFTPHLTVRVHHGAARLTGAVDGVDLVLTTYQVATRDVDTLAAVGWDRVVLDEAQHVKNAAGVTARAVRRLPARHRVALTGTPVENRLTELWSIADFLNPGLLGEASLFRARYSVPIERWGDEDTARRLRRVTRPFLLRRVKTDRAVIADLPEKFERRQWCNLTLEQATLYKAVVDELFVKLREGRAGPQRKGLVLSAMTKLKQVCNHPAHLMGDGTPLAGRSGKLARLEEILAAATAAGDRALVFTQFARFGHLLAPHLAQQLGTGVEFLHGGTPKGARDRMVERFQSGSGPGVLLVSLKAGGTGLNLTAANHVVHVDRWWNPATEAQATDRAFRIGQRRDVQVHTFVCIGTIEERVEEIMVSKRDLAGVAVGSGEGWLTGLSTNDLLELMSLAPEAVGDA
ncbi:SNF2-related protein [Dactylosporangium sp. NPDC049140]|uniref:DEAD/DEAH box helicase n=1 Tax=Dactylosporangium sp. NPDC049140 TaxID=3155647 RepID=UPI0033D16004